MKRRETFLNRGIRSTWRGARTPLLASVAALAAAGCAPDTSGEVDEIDVAEAAEALAPEPVIEEEAGVAPTAFNDAWSVLASGFVDCMGSGMQCQIAKNLTPFTCPPMTLCKFNPNATLTVYTSGGGVSGAPTQAGWRCGSTFAQAKGYLEVYVDDPQLTWPSFCVPLGSSFQMNALKRYDIRGPSVSGGGAAPIPFYLHAEALLAPTNLSVISNGSMKLNWTDNSWGEDGHRVERRYQYIVTNPTNASVRIGVAAPYIDSSVANTLWYSARQYCIQHGYTDYATIGIASPVGGVHTYWSSGSWVISGNNNVYYLTNLRCQSAWSEIATTGPDQTTYTDALNWSAERQDYRVRASKGATFTTYSNIAGDIPKVIVGL